MLRLKLPYVFVSLLSVYTILPVGCQDVSATVAASIQTLLNEETVLRTKLEAELRQLNSELGSLQALRKNGKISYFDVF